MSPSARTHYYKIDGLYEDVGDDIDDGDGDFEVVGILGKILWQFCIAMKKTRRY